MAAIDDATVLLQARNYSGSGNWLDDSGNGHDATPVNSPTWTDAGVDSYWTFDSASSEYFTIADHADLDFANTDEFTLVGVIANVDTGLNRPIAAKRTSGVVGYMIQTGRSVARQPNFFIGSTGWVENVGTAHDANRHTIVGRRTDSPDEIKLYVDGSNVDTDSATGVTGSHANGETLNVGRYQSTYFEGRIYVIALWRRALTAGEISGLDAEFFPVLGTLAETEANDTISASGTAATAITGSLAETEANDTLSASGLNESVAGGDATDILLLGAP